MRALLLAALLLPACSGLSQGCTEVGAEPFVRVSAAQPDGVQVRVCLDGDCQQAPWREGTVQLPVALPEEGAVDLEVAVLGSGEAVLDSDAVRAELEAFTPNGPDCPPRVGVVDLERAGGRYAQVDAPEAG